MNKNEPKISLVVISLGIAIILWLYVMGEVDPNVNQRFNNIPVTIENMEILEEKGLVLTEDTNYTVGIRVYGRTSSMYGLKNKLSASIDVSGIEKKGVYDAHVSISGLPDSIELNTIYPETIPLTVDRMGEVEKEVVISFEGEPQRGLQVMDYSASPSTVTLTGPEELLKQVDRVQGVVDVGGVSSDVHEKVKIQAIDAEGKPVEGVTLSTASSNVNVEVGKMKKIQIKPNLIGQVAEGYQIADTIVEPKEITIGTKGNGLDDVNEILTEPIDIDGIQSNIETEVELQLPSGVKIIGSDSTKVKVSIAVESIISKGFPIDTIKLVNKPEGMDVNLEEANIRVELEGQSADMEKVKAENVVLFVDLEGITEGKGNIEIQMEPIDKIHIKNISPRTIAVTATKRDEIGLE